MANTTALTGRFLQITGLDADWTLTTDMPGMVTGGLNVKSIRYHPSGADRFIVHNKSIDAAAIFDVNCADVYDDRIQYYDEKVPMFPVIDISDCTLAVAANARLVFELA